MKNLPRFGKIKRVNRLTPGVNRLTLYCEVIFVSFMKGKVALLNWLIMGHIKMIIWDCMSVYGVFVIVCWYMLDFISMYIHIWCICCDMRLKYIIRWCMFYVCVVIGYCYMLRVWVCISSCCCCMLYVWACISYTVVANSHGEELVSMYGGS